MVEVGIPRTHIYLSVAFYLRILTLHGLAPNKVYSPTLLLCEIMWLETISAFGSDWFQFIPIIALNSEGLSVVGKGVESF